MEKSKFLARKILNLGAKNPKSKNQNRDSLIQNFRSHDPKIRNSRSMDPKSNPISLRFRSIGSGKILLNSNFLHPYQNYRQFEK